MAKSHRLPFLSSESKTNVPFELAYSNLWGPSPVTSVNGAQYFVLFIDDCTRFCWLYLINSKTDVLPIFLKFKAMIENQFNTNIKALQTDGGTEFRSLYPILSLNGILHRISCPYTPQQNGCVERKNRHVVEVGLSLLAHSSLPQSYWSYVFQTAVFLINRLPSSVLNFQSPYFALYKSMPDYNLIKCFGCSCFPFLRPYNDHKLQYRSYECVFLG